MQMLPHLDYASSAKQAFFLFFVLLSGETFSQESGNVCPRQWNYYWDACYLFVRTTELNWADAQVYCQKYFANLVSVETYGEHGFIAKWLERNDPVLATWHTSGFDALISGEFIWTTSNVEDRRISNNDPAWIRYDQTPYGSNSRRVADAASISSNIGRVLAYNFSSSTKTWSWLPVTPERILPFICELPAHLVAHIPEYERNLDYGIVAENDVQLPAGPVIIQEPTDVVFDSTFRSFKNWTTVRCTASGIPLPEYSWYKIRYESGKELSYLVDALADVRISQTNGALTLYEPLSSRDRGEYYCSATNRYGTVISKRISVNFGYIGDFALRRETMTVVMYNGAAVPCDPPPFFPAVTYAWARDAFPNFVEENRRVFVSKDGNLYLSHVELYDEGTYQCIVKSSIADVGKTGPFFKVVVRREQSVGQLKIWSSFPKIFPLLPVAGDNVTLECFASGYPTPVYEWKRLSGEALSPGHRILKHKRVLLLPNAQISDSGEYECRVSSQQRMISAVVTLDVKAKPHFLSPLTPHLADTGTDVTWTCAAFGKPAVTYKWYKNGDPLQYQSMKTEELGHYQIDANRLIVRHVQEARDNGIYQCEAMNILGSALSAAELRVISLPPSFRRHPLNAVSYAVNGSNITIPCQPEGAPKPLIRWLYNGEPLIPSPRTVLLGSGSLSISPVFPEDEGSYICEASSSLGMDSSSGYLKVLREPRMLEVPSSEVIPFNNSAILRCTADADPLLDISYEWLLNGLPIHFSEMAQFYTGWKQNRGYVFIRQLTYSEAGEYSCIIKTPIAELNHRATLEVIGPPGPPSGLLIAPLAMNPTSVTFRLTDGARHGLDSLFYKVESLSNHTSSWTTLLNHALPTRVTNFGRKEIDLIGTLHPWTAYRFRVSAGNTLGWSEPSVPSALYEVSPTVPFRAPTRISGGGGRDGDLIVTWEALPPAEQNGPGIGYKIMFRKVASGNNFREEVILGNKNRAAFRIGMEEIYQPYEVGIKAFNIIGDGPVSETVIVYSAESAPLAAPTNAAGASYNSTAIKVTWRPIPNSREILRGDLLGHRVKYWRRDWDQEDAWTVFFPKENESALIKGLDPFTEYFISVMAVNSAGNGPESEPVIGRTFRSEPKAFPMGVRVRIRDWSSVMIDWRGIMTGPQEEPIEGYKIRYWRQGEDIKAANDLILPVNSLFGKLETVLGGLTAGQAYNLRVLAYSRGGDGRMSSPVWQFRMAVPNSSPKFDWSKGVQPLCLAIQYLFRKVIFCHFTGTYFPDLSFH